MKRYTPLGKLPQEAMTITKNYLRVWADGIKARGCPICLHNDETECKLCHHQAMLIEIAESFIALDDHMKGGGELPTGWSFFTEKRNST